LYKYGTFASGEKNSIAQLPLQTWKHIVKAKLKSLRKHYKHYQSTCIFTTILTYNI
jgi:hypothetical protein